MMSPPRLTSTPSIVAERVAALDPGLVGRPVLDDGLDEHAFLDRQVDRLRQFGGDRAAADAEEGVFDFAGRLQLVDLGA